MGSLWPIAAGMKIGSGLGPSHFDTRHFSSSSRLKFFLNLSFLPKQNNCHFDTLYITAIGTKFAPAYANLFMTRLEERLVDTSVEKPLI